MNEFDESFWKRCELKSSLTCKLTENNYQKKFDKPDYMSIQEDL